ncbi:SMP-30/gluconolactonase/LRE family protein [Streptomyces vilmorinianum]|uniref:SMP-30/gluconolactonase/LRE family protein n=1 Tax=Streptomyces vilmorinianum TaxID=3051092 RepID=UPI0010FB97E2|nr:SMP-30/gluconolactonase/LRE family protein [Streptomyces vilmorinianum]
MPRLPRLVAAATATVALTVLASGPTSAGEPTVTDPRVVAHFDFALGQTPENIALEPDGSANLTLSFARQVANVDKHGAQRIVATLPAVANPNTPIIGAAAAMGIARAHDGTLYVVYATGTSETGIWRIKPGGSAPVQIAELPADGLPNSLALDEKCGVFYVADSVLGTVWRVPQEGGTPTAWATGTELQPLAAPDGFGVGANGIKVHNGAVWVSNTDRQTLLRIPVLPDESAGTIETRATGLTWIDDFAFTGHDDTVLATLIMDSELALVRPDGTHTVVLTGQDGLSNPTSVAVRGETVYVPSASYFAPVKDPNLLLARLNKGKS